MKPASSVVLFVCAVCAASARADLPVVEVSPGVYRGPAPETAADYRQLRALGVRTVLDVRKFRKGKMDQECRCANLHGLTYKRTPVSFRPQKDGSAERALRALADVRLHPIYIHCELGRDRSGLIIGLYRVRCEGWTMQSAYAEMKRFGFRSYFRGLENYFWAYAKCGRR